MAESVCAAIREFLAERVMDAGYRLRFANASCRCGCTVFALELDEDVGEAAWLCDACRMLYLLSDSGRDQASPQYEGVDCVCTCGNDRLEIVVGVTLYGDKDDFARTAYLGCRCVACNRIACYGSWPRVDHFAAQYFANMTRPRDS